MGNLSRLMPNIGGPREKKRRLVATVGLAKQLDAAPAWADALKTRSILDKLLSLQTGSSRRVISAYRTVSDCAALVLASTPPTDLLAKERQEVFQVNKEQAVSGEQQSRGSLKLAIRKAARIRLVDSWQAR